MDTLYDFAFSVQGYNHIKSNKVCQDSSGHYSDDIMSIAVVADGHGSSDYPRTDRGSRFAVEAALSSIQEFVKTVEQDGIDIETNSDTYLEQLAKSILSKWYSSVEEDVANHPFTDEELENISERYKKRYLSGKKVEKAYGTTLIAACQTARYWFGVQIGDGKCVAIAPDGTIGEPIPWDENCQANITTSICDSDAINEFRYAYLETAPIATLMGSDGIDDSYSGDEELYTLYRSILAIFAEHGREVGEQEVHDFLPGLSRKGSGDDVSIAGIISSSVSVSFINLLKAQCEYSNALVQRDTAEHEVQLAAERYEYIHSALQKAKMNYETCVQKEADSLSAVENAENTYRAMKSRFEQAALALETAKKDFLRPESDVVKEAGSPIDAE